MTPIPNIYEHSTHIEFQHNKKVKQNKLQNWNELIFESASGNFWLPFYFFSPVLFVILLIFSLFLRYYEESYQLFSLFFLYFFFLILCYKLFIHHNIFSASFFQKSCSISASVWCIFQASVMKCNKFYIYFDKKLNIFKF